MPAQGRCHFEFPCALDKHLDKLVGDGLFDDDAAGGGAALAGRGKRAETVDSTASGRSASARSPRDFCRPSRTGISSLLRAVRIELAADFVRTSEGDGAHIGMLQQLVANLLARADNHVQHAGRNARLLENLDYLRCEIGVSLAGLKTTVFPATNAGAIFHTGIETGKFHGAIAPTTPSGCFIV